MFEHRFLGCKSKPLASYLKGLGIYRLLAEQKDPRASVRWDVESLSIKTCLNKEELALFFCEEYAPTPIVSPWNGSSGFYPSTFSSGMGEILKSSANRFSVYRDVITNIKSWDFMPTEPKTVGDLLRFLDESQKTMRTGKARNEIVMLIEDVEKLAPGENLLHCDDFHTVEINAIKSMAKAKTKEEQKSLGKWQGAIKKGLTKCIGTQRSADRQKIFRYARAVLPDASMLWLDAVYSINRAGKALYSPLLGTGGNDSRLDLSKNFIDNVALLFLNGKAVDTYRLLEQALYGSTVPGFVDGKIGMFDPGRAGGFNQGSEIETKDFKINPWDFVLMIEGTLILASSMACRNLIKTKDEFTAPFTVDFSPVGFASNDYKEGGREIWMPLWENWASFSELKHIFGEGRSTLGRKSAQRGTDFCIALGSFGVDRGITAFERFVFIENRRGDCQVAVPAGLMQVKYRPGVELLEELDPLLSQTDGFIKILKGRNHWDRVPARLLEARRQIDQAILNCARQPGPQRFQALLRALGRLERFFAFRDRSQTPKLHKPLFGLSPRWISASDDGRVEIRLAAALASICPSAEIGSFRSCLTPVDSSVSWKWSAAPKQKMWLGSNLPERLSAVFAGRLVDAEKWSLKFPPFKALLSIRSHDVMPFLFGYCDDELLEELLWGLTLTDYRKDLGEVWDRWKHQVHWQPLSRTWGLLKILYSPHGIRKTAIKLEPRIPSLLLAGRVREACQVAIRRLSIEGLDPFEVDYQEDLDPTRLLASLMIPVRDGNILENMVLNYQDEMI